MSSRHIIFAEERAPVGVPGLLSWEYYPGQFRKQAPIIDDILVNRPMPHILVLWEPLATKTPGPHLTRPWCCYINTIVFYRWPFLTLPPKPWRDHKGILHHGTTGSFFAWDTIEHRVSWGAMLRLTGSEEVFDYGGGSVLWKKRRWWMRFYARRKLPVPSYQQ